MDALSIGWFQPEPLLGVFHPFGILLAVAIYVGWRTASWFGDRQGLNRREQNRLLTWGLSVGLLACYFLNGLFYEPEKLLAVLRYPPRLFDSNYYLGMSSFGGFIGMLLGALAWKWRSRRSILEYGDSAVFALVPAWIFGRTGCFLAHDHMGTETTSPLGIEWPVEFNLAGNVVGTCYPSTDTTFAELVMQGVCGWQIRHDMGLYEVFFAIAATALLLGLVRKRRQPGFYMILVPLLYTPFRFALDFLRSGIGDDPRTLGLVPSQYACLAFFLVGVSLLLWRRPWQPVAAEAIPAESIGDPPSS